MRGARIMRFYWCLKIYGKCFTVLPSFLLPRAFMLGSTIETDGGYKYKRLYLLLFKREKKSQEIKNM